MDIIKCITTRRSVRNYTHQLISSDAIDELLRLATLAPTGSNQQPWGFIVIQDKDEIEALNQAIKADLLAHLDEIPQFQQYRSGLENPKFSVLNHASNLVIIYGNTAAHYYVYDCTLAASNLMMAGRSMGIESCWIGFGEYYFNSPAFKEKYGIPAEFELVSPMTLGYPASKLSEGPARKAPMVFHRT